MSQTSRIDKERVISVPKHLLRFRDEISPYGKHKEVKTVASRILLNSKKVKNGLSRGQTMYSRTQVDDVSDLVNVERNFVRDLIKSPLKSKSPLITESNKNLSPGKKKVSRNRFESLTICDFLGRGIKKRRSESKRSKCSTTPDMGGKKK